MASQVLSGATNASYTNNTGQNVRLIINYMSNVTSMTWAGVNVTASATTIGKDIQNIYGEFRQAVRGTITNISGSTGGSYGGLSETYGGQIQQLVVSSTKVVTVEGSGTLGYFRLPASSNNNFNEFYASTNFSLSGGVKGGVISYPNIFYVPLTVSRGGNFPVELMLANGQVFSAVCGAFNAIVIREDGT
jgi:hypothetical protein